MINAEGAQDNLPMAESTGSGGREKHGSRRCCPTALQSVYR